MNYHDPFDWREPHEAARQRDHVLRAMPLIQERSDNSWLYMALTAGVFALIIIGGVLTA